MVAEAASHAEEDKLRREVVDLKNQVDTLAFSLEKTLKENGDKVPASEKAEAEAAIAEGRKAGEGDNQAELRSAVDRLTRVSHSVAEGLYKGAAGPGDGAAPKAGANGDVVDAEYTVKN